MCLSGSAEEQEPAPRPFRVLFCGPDMHFGYVFTKEALAGDEGVEVEQCQRSELPLRLPAADVAVPLMSRLDAQLLRAADRLKLIIQYGVGVEAVDIPTASELGVWVSNIPSAGTGNAIGCAEHAMYLMMATLRDHNAMADSIRHRQLGVPLGQTLFGKTVLIVGFGGIAKELAIRLRAFGVRVTALRRKPWATSSDSSSNAAGEQQQDGRERQVLQLPVPRLHRPHDPELDAAAESVLADRGCWPTDCARLAGEADIIALTCHQDESNRGMVDETFLACCKHGVRIVNVARGGLLDYDAIKDALFTGRVAGLGLDVQAQEPIDPQDWLVHHPCVYLTPHIAGVTEMSYRNMAEVVVAAARRVRAGLPPHRLLNTPERPRSAGMG